MIFFLHFLTFVPYISFPTIFFLFLLHRFWLSLSIPSAPLLCACVCMAEGGGLSLQMLRCFSSEITVPLFRYLSGLNGKCENKCLWHRTVLNPKDKCFNPLNPELNPICYLLALLGAHHFLHVSRIRVKILTFRRPMSYIYIYIYMEHPFLMFLDHTQRRSTVGRTPLDE